jgi:hypothetical protein
VWGAAALRAAMILVQRNFEVDTEIMFILGFRAVLIM